MRVNLQTQGLEGPDKSKTNRTAAPRSTSQPETVAADQANLAFDQARLQGLAAAALAQPEVRTQKVEALRQAVGKGEYAVSDGQIADALAADLRG